ncbi:MAG: beta-carotene isomerase domain-containing protein [Geminocystis sp.]|nr:beta-carotene isomerase domain-containing protein [Geminocystis sp.]MCS7147899.1 beta-carotene isomerase domain-containing protein [Geminocystis sp.]MCX8078725.1 beta-carotene isomerase domain-containing protein [Geminocystis sp.]
MAKALGTKTRLRGYDGFVDLSKQIMTGRNPQQQQELVEKVLKSLIPPCVVFLIRTFFPPSKWVCEFNATFATILFEWLVGKSEVREVEIVGENGEIRRQKSGVYIHKCRYLEASGCVAMCVNMCKLPTQKFFTEYLRIPLTMTPNFEDFSCEMVFGKSPPPFTSEAVYNQPCLQDTCSQAVVSHPPRPCSKIRVV